MNINKKPSLKNLFLCISVILCISACNKQVPISKASNLSKPQLQAEPKPATSTAVKKSAKEITPTIFNSVPKFSALNHKKENITNADLYGYVWIANFIQTDCKETCQALINKMLELQNSLKGSNRWSDMRLVSINTETKTDSLNILANNIKAAKLETSQWHFLSDSQQELSQLIKQGFNLALSSDSLLPKNAETFVLIDWEGNVRGHYNALNDQAYADLKRDLVKVVNERVEFPQGVIRSKWTTERKREQLLAAKDFEVFSDFTFQNKIQESDIRFKHNIVDDIGINYKAVHYDHGNAIAVADIDLDGLHDIYFSTQVGSNELWKNLGQGKFTNITKLAGLYFDDRIGVGASFADIDNDGDQDLYTTSVRVGNQLFENDGAGKFTDITQESGTGLQAHSSGAVFFDYNKDGLLDLFVSNVGIYTEEKTQKATTYTQQGQIQTDSDFYIGFKDAFAGHLKPERFEKSVLYKNLGNNKFLDVTEKTNLNDVSWTGEASVIDGNNDGWPDLYVLNMQGHDEYYQNNQGKNFIRKSRDTFPKTPWGAMGSTVFDFDNDGDMDIFITDMHSDMSKEVFGAEEKLKADITYTESFLRSEGKSIYGNAFFRNDGNGKFTEISDQINAETYWPWGLSSGDVNADGYEDIFVTAGMNYPFRYAANSLLLNNKGKSFLDSEYVLGIEPRLHKRHADASFALDCKHLNKEHRLCQNQEGRIVVWGALGSRSSVIFDIDYDGDQDIITSESNSAPMVLMSNLSNKKTLNFIKVNLVGTKSNKNGIGATVTVYSGDNAYTKVQNGKSGYLSQSNLPLYFGLNDNTKISKIEVSWPSGVKQSLSNTIKTNQILTIREPN